MLREFNLLAPDLHSKPRPLVLSGVLDFIEIYAGCGNLTEACVLRGLRVGPPVDAQPFSKWPAMSFQWDLQAPEHRRLLWALAVAM